MDIISSENSESIQMC